uniref:Uncharacterized protein n=1 Tax=Panagrolaimus davidi TaxID=227884 RepID=A0A914PM33_9BILA
MSPRFNCDRLKDKVAIVTAATQGKNLRKSVPQSTSAHPWSPQFKYIMKIGLAIAERLAHEGAKVIISSRKQKNVDEAIDYIVSTGICRNRLAGMPCHVGEEEQLKKLVDFTLQKFGKIDILVNNAGINPAFGSALEVGNDLFDKLFAVNVKSGFILTKLVVPIMEKQGYV